MYRAIGCSIIYNSRSFKITQIAIKEGIVILNNYTTYMQ